jgi:tetratricopeptide (TPR) repeat protein
LKEIIYDFIAKYDIITMPSNVYFYNNKMIQNYKYSLKAIMVKNRRQEKKYMGENKKEKSTENSFKGNRKNITVHEIDLSECGKYQELNGSWVIWMLISGIILCFKNLYSGIALIAISIIIFLIYKRSNKNISATYFNLALDYINKDKMEDAKDMLGKAVQVNPENSLAYVLLSSIYYKEDNYKDTIDNLLKSNVLKVPHSKYNYLVGVCYFKIEDYKNSIKYLNTVKYEDENIMKYVRDVLLAKAYCLNEDYKQALKVFNRILYIQDDLKGNLIEFNYFLGLTYLKLGEKDKANVELTKVYKEDSNYRDIEILVKGLS